MRGTIKRHANIITACGINSVRDSKQLGTDKYLIESGTWLKIYGKLPMHTYRNHSPPLKKFNSWKT